MRFDANQQGVYAAVKPAFTADTLCESDINYSVINTNNAKRVGMCFLASV